MGAQEIAIQLRSIAAMSDFAERTAEITAAWSSEGVGFEAVDPVLRFMEEYASADFGAPGALVHFVEHFYGKGYEDKLVESIERRPTAITVWMLNRIINGTKRPDIRQRFVNVMECVRLNPHADENAIQRANSFLERIASEQRGA